MRILVGFPPSGATDLIARILQPALAKAFGREIVVENRPGASGVLAADLTAKSASTAPLNLVSHSARSSSAPRWPACLTPRSAISRRSRASPSYATSSWRGPSLAAQTLPQLVDMAKAKPGSITYASPGLGSAGHLTGELFARIARIEWTHVPYEGGGPVMTDFLGGQVDLFVGVVSTAVPYVQQGRARAVAESGWADFDATTWYPLIGPAGLPAPIVDAGIASSSPRSPNRRSAGR